MNPVSAMLVAYACISPVEPAGASHTVAYMCAPPLVEVAAAPVKPMRVKRQMASRCDGTASECRMSRAECGREFADWRTSKGRRKFRCR